MSDHFEQGEYEVWQGKSIVGRLVAVDSPSIAEYWYLFVDVPAGDPTYATYTAPGDTATAPKAGMYGLDLNVEWTFRYLGPVSATFNAVGPDGYAVSLTGSLPGFPAAVTRVPKPITAAKVDCASHEGGSGPIVYPQPNWQIAWNSKVGSGYVLSSGTTQVGIVQVPKPAGSIVREAWIFSPSYAAPGSANPNPTFHFQYVDALTPLKGTAFCVDCSRPVQ